MAVPIWGCSTESDGGWRASRYPGLAPGRRPVPRAGGVTGETGGQAARGGQMLIWAGAVRVGRRGPACGKHGRALVFRSRSMTTRRRARPASARSRLARASAAGRLAVAAPERPAPSGHPSAAPAPPENASQRPGRRSCPPGPAVPGQPPWQDRRRQRKPARVCETGRAAKLPGSRGSLTQIPTASGASLLSHA